MPNWERVKQGDMKNDPALTALYNSAVERTDATSDGVEFPHGVEMTVVCCDWYLYRDGTEKDKTRRATPSLCCRFSYEDGLKNITKDKVDADKALLDKLHNISFKNVASKSDINSKGERVQNQTFLNVWVREIRIAHRGKGNEALFAAMNEKIAGKTFIIDRLDYDKDGTLKSLFGAFPKGQINATVDKTTWDIPQ